MEYDYVVIGGGTSGLVLSSRLAERGEKVLVIEAGIDPKNDENITSASNFVTNVGGSYDYGFSITDTSVPMPRGKFTDLLRHVNNSRANRLWNRPSKYEIELWHKLGIEGWSFENVWKCMKKAETYIPPSQTQMESFGMPAPDNKHYGSSGPITLSYQRYISPTDRRWLETIKNIGLPINENPHDGENLGANISPITADPNKHRRTYGCTYLDALPTASLDILTQTIVNRIETVTEDGQIRATAVEYCSEGVTESVKIRKEVILTAGTINTPQILELSGIGDTNILASHGIKEVLNIPTVGEYRGHYYPTLCYQLNDTVKNMDVLRQDEQIRREEAEKFRKGDPSLYHQAASCVLYLKPAQILTKEELDRLESLLREANSNEERVLAQYFLDERIPQVEIDMVGFFADLNSVPEDGKKYVTFMVGLQHPFSKGSIHVSSSDVNDKPNITSNYNKHPIDRLLLSAAIRFIREKIVTGNPLTDIISKEVSPGRGVSVEEFIENAPACDYHPSSSAKMGNSIDDSVVNSELKVHKTRNIRVSDASIIPLGLSSHIQSIVYAIAEKAVDLL
ncbi:alcohol oxidase [Wallemia mellicola]|nr:alcohol oxidase [Wallemia mellicola]